MADDKGDIVALPEEKEARMKLLEGLYNSLSHMDTDLEKFSEIIRQTAGQASIRSLKRYKKEGAWGGGVKPQKKKPKKTKGSNTVQLPISENTKKRLAKVETEVLKMPGMEGEEGSLVEKLEALPVPVARPRKYKHNGPWTDAQIDVAVKIICEYYALGTYTIFDLCESQGISHTTFSKWLNQNEGYWHQWQEAKMKHSLQFLLIIEEYLKSFLLKIIRNEKVQETTRVYQFRDGRDAKGKKCLERFQVEERVTEKTNRLDSKSMEFLWGLLREAKANLRSSDTSQLDRYDNMSVEELQMEIDRERQALETQLDRESQLGIMPVQVDEN